MRSPSTLLSYEKKKKKKKQKTTKTHPFLPIFELSFVDLLKLSSKLLLNSSSNIPSKGRLKGASSTGAFKGLLQGLETLRREAEGGFEGFEGKVEGKLQGLEEGFKGLRGLEGELEGLEGGLQGLEELEGLGTS